ncbi:MAG: hypothetical protein JWP01_3310 [Myxococcales bacterium]|nr:hypothetical protein [Myxococcales bacterium]
MHAGPRQRTQGHLSAVRALERRELHVNQAENWRVGWILDRATFLAVADAVFAGRSVDAMLNAMEHEMYGGPLRYNLQSAASLVWCFLRARGDP